MVSVHSLAALAGATLLLAACGEGQGRDNSAAKALNPPTNNVPFASEESLPEPDKVAGLSAPEGESIKQSVRLRLLSRRYGMYNPRLCTDVFSLGEPVLSDALLTDQTGKVKIVVPISVHTLPNPNSTGRSWVPADSCYGVNVNFDGVTPVPIGFEFDLERWQSGWRLAQPRAGGF
jgi:hypothetical protein